MNPRMIKIWSIVRAVLICDSLIDFLANLNIIKNKTKVMIEIQLFVTQ